MISLLDFIHPALPGPNLTHSRWGTIWPYAGRNHGHKMRHKWPPVGSLRWPSTPDPQLFYQKIPTTSGAAVDYGFHRGAKSRPSVTMLGLREPAPHRCE